MKKILVCDPISIEAIEILKEAGFVVDEKYGIDSATLLSLIEKYDAVLLRGRTKIEKEHIERAKNLKVIGRAGVGLDNIDIEAARERNIEVLNTPGATTVSVAELVIGLMISCMRLIPQAHISVKDGKWEKSKFFGEELYGKCLGIIGLGRIGREVAKRAIAFSMKVIGYDVIDFEIEGVERVQLDDLLRKSDIVTLHVPLIDSTYHMINHETISKMKDGVVIVNCSRGGVIDEEALYKALKRKKVRAAALDVFEKEPPYGSKLLELENVIFTPHIGGQTIEGQRRAGSEIAIKVRDFLLKERNA